MKLRHLPLALALLVTSVTLPSCSTVPITGRSQMNFVPAEQELELGLTAFQQMKEETPISQDPQANALVEKVGKRVAAVASSDLPEAQWEFVVFESDQANAFCLPGGKVGVYTGILPITQDEAGLATVIGHEVAHAVARHGAERMSQAVAMQTGGSALGAMLGSTDPKLQAAAGIAYSLGSQVGVALPYSRIHESEADRMGLIYMARAGYDPSKAIEFWKRFSEASGDGGTPWFLRTHPLTTDRIQQIRDYLPEAMAIYEQSTISQ